MYLKFGDKTNAWIFSCFLFRLSELQSLGMLSLEYAPIAYVLSLHISQIRFTCHIYIQGLLSLISWIEPIF